MEELKLTFVNVGYGEAALLECPDPAFPGGTFVMVIDGGSAEAEEYRDSATGRIPLDQYLSLRGVDHIDLMAATHVHEDHLCGLLPAAEKLASSCRALYEEADPSAFWQRLDQLDAAMNNYSLILLLEYRGTRILLPGDTNHMGYGGLDPASLRADLFKVGHHGQRDGISAEQIQAIAPRAVVCCASSDRRYNSADPAILQMMADSGARLYFSDCPPGPDGAVPPPHQALTFTVGAGGAMEGTYLSIPD